MLFHLFLVYVYYYTTGVIPVLPISYSEADLYMHMYCAPDFKIIRDMPIVLCYHGDCTVISLVHIIHLFLLVWLFESTRINTMYYSLLYSFSFSLAVNTNILRHEPCHYAGVVMWLLNS